MINLTSVNIGVIETINLLCVLVAFSMSVFLAKKRLKQKKLFHQYFVYGLNFLASTALILLILQPNIEIKSSTSLTLVVGLSDNVLNENRPVNSNEFWLVSERTKRSLPRALKRQSISQVDELLLMYPSITEITVIGDGLSAFEWNKFDNVKINYSPPIRHSGLLNPSWNRKINLGEMLSFTARFVVNRKSEPAAQATDKQVNNSASIFTAKLFDPAGNVVDEIQLLSNENFRLSDIPKIDGKHLYQLQIFDRNQKLVNQETLPVWVTNKSQLKLITIQSSPSFEIKQLQNWMIEFGAQVLQITQISKDKSISRLTNIKSNSKISLLSKELSKGISQPLLELFDLAVIDGRALASMQEKQKRYLVSSIKNGLGLIVIVDAMLMKEVDEGHIQLFDDLVIQKLSKSSDVLIYLNNNNGKNLLSEAPLPIIARGIISNRSDHQLKDLFVDSLGNGLVSNQSHGFGKVSLSLLSQTNQWATSGQLDKFSKLWQHLIKNTARHYSEVKIFSSGEKRLPAKNFRTKICFSGVEQPLNKTITVVPSKKHNNFKEHHVVLQQNPMLPSSSCGYFWPKQAGWYDAELTSESKAKFSSKSSLESSSELIDNASFYVFDSNSWLADIQDKTIQATLDKQSNFIDRENKLVATSKVDEWVFWWLFLTSATILWIERKRFY